MERTPVSLRRLDAEQLLGQMIRVMAIAAFSVIMLLLTCYSHVNYLMKVGYATQNPVKLLLAVAAMLGVICYTVFHPHSWMADWFQPRIRAFTCVLFLVQIYILTNIFFITDWDPDVVYSIIKTLQQGEKLTGWYADYLPKYANNALFLLIEEAVLRLNSYAGIIPESYELMMMGILNCLIMSFTCYQTYQLLFAYTKSTRCAAMGYVASVILIGLSPWMVIGYTDTLGLLFPILILRLFSNENKGSKRQRILIWCAIVVTAAIGYFIKPQCLIVFIAICSVKVFRKLTKRHIFQIIALLLAFAAFSSCASSAIKILIEQNGIVLKSERKYGWQHFLMMGLNYERNGIYSQEDVNFSAAFSTAEERNEQNLAVAKERLISMKGNIFDHLAKKTLIAFNDGMFAWGKEGGFYQEIFEEPNLIVSPFLRSVFYTTGSRYYAWASFVHTVWIGVLFLALVGCVLDKHPSEQTNVMRLSLLGLMLFELLFEVRARYLFTYTPFFIILAVEGIYSAKCSFRRWLGRKLGISD